MSATLAFARHARHPFDRHIALSSNVEDIALFQQEGMEVGVKALLIDMRAHLSGFDLDKIPNGLSIRYGQGDGFTPQDDLYFIQAFISTVESLTGLTRYSMGVHTGFGQDPGLGQEIMPSYVPWNFDWGDVSFVQTNFNLHDDQTGTWFACDDLQQHDELLREVDRIEAQHFSGTRDLCRTKQDRVLRENGIHIEQVPFGFMLASRGSDTGMGLLHAGDTAKERKTLQVRYRISG